MLLFASCTNISRKEESKEYIEIMKYYDAWELNEVDKLMKIYPLSLEEKNNVIKLLNIRKRQKKELSEFENFIKQAIYEGNISKLEKYITEGFTNKIKLSSLKDLETKGTKVYFGRRKFYKNKLELLMAINYYEDNLYVELQLKYENGRWQIESFSERR